MRLLGAFLIVCVLAVSSVISLQTHTLSGTVVDPAGQPIPGVAVELRKGTAVERRTTSNAAGAWRFDNVGAGDYAVRHTLAGFVTTELRCSVGAAAPAPFRVVMKVGAVSETVDVQQAMPIGGAGRGAERGVLGGVVGGVAGGVMGGAPAPPPPPAAVSPVGAPKADQVRIAGQMGSATIVTGLPYQTSDTASYAAIEENRFRRVSEHPLSTFSIDVDTASYANVRRFLNMGTMPPADAVRIEELINYFRFDYPEPRGDAPASVTTELGAAPWDPTHTLALVGLRSAPIRQERTPPRNLTFLLDVSGSMSPVNRLPLVKTAMQMLADTLRPDDRVAIVVYAGASGLALPATSGARKDVIKNAIQELRAGGSTNGASGIQLAYNIAAENFVKEGINRVILATDGDFNVGITSHADLVRLIEGQRNRGIFLSVLGVGDDNLKDSTMEMLADKGNGNYSYLDSIQEARRVLIHEAGSTLVTVAKDVKLQIEFNPRFVGAYRLIGYENRMLRKEDFNNDRKDAGEMGAGHTVTALYELIPPGQPISGGSVDPLKYQTTPEKPAAVVSQSDELMNIKLRYKAPDGDTSRLLEFPVRSGVKSVARLSSNLGFAAAVAEFGMLLRRSEFAGRSTWSQAASLAREHRGRDEDGYRAEFIRLVELAAALDVKNTEPDPTGTRR
jgi:Ca-activated chloride channel homolog